MKITVDLSDHNLNETSYSFLCRMAARLAADAVEKELRAAKATDDDAPRAPGSVVLPPKALEQMVAKAEDLLEESDSLRSFMNDPLFRALSEVERNLLDNQHNAMRAYLSILTHRIAFYEEKTTVKEKPMVRSHWFCAVEVDMPEGEMPRGCDSIPRRAVEEAIRRVHPEAVIGEFASGWNPFAFRFQRVCKISCFESNTVDIKQVRRRG